MLRIDLCISLQNPMLRIKTTVADWRLRVLKQSKPYARISQVPGALDRENLIQFRHHVCPLLVACTYTLLIKALHLK